MTRRERFRAWRRSRPCWGGLLLLLAGLELLLIPLGGDLGHGAIKLVIYIGIGGVFGVLIGLLLIAAGVMHRSGTRQRGDGIGIAAQPVLHPGDLLRFAARAESIRLGLAVVRSAPVALGLAPGGLVRERLGQGG